MLIYVYLYMYNHINMLFIGTAGKHNMKVLAEIFIVQLLMLKCE